MQQIFNVALDIDTEGIERRITDKAEQTIIDRMYDNMEKKLNPKSWERERYYSGLVDKAAGKFLAEHKDEIISQIASRYTAWAKHSPKVRGAVKGDKEKWIALWL